MSKTRKPADWQTLRFRRVSVSTALVCVLIAALLALCALGDALEKRYGWRVDMSFNALTTQSETTLEVLASLEHPVHIYALYARGREDLPLLELLDRYSAASRLVTWEQADASLNPALIARYTGGTSDVTVMNDSLIVACEETGRWKILYPSDFISASFNYEEGVYEPSGVTYESSLTSAISYVAQDRVPRAMILQGHGELDMNATGVLASLLAANNYDVGYFTLNTTETALVPEDLLLILSPQIDLREDELAQLTAFADQGGSILFTVDYADPTDRMPRLASLLRYYGFVHKPGLVIASPQEPNTYYNNNRIYLIPYMQATDVTAPLVEGRTDTLLLTGSGAFALPEETTDRALTVETVLLSGTRAYLHDISDGQLDQTERDEMGPFALALQAQRVTDAGYVSRAFVLGCSTVLTSAEVYAITYSQEFILRAAQYLANEQPVSYQIMAKAAVRPGLSAGSVALGMAVAFGLPGLVLIAAVVVLRRRKNL